MEIRLRFFASVREKLHRSEATCSLPDGATVGQLLDAVCRDFPPVAPVRHSLAVAVNHEYVHESYVLNPEDEVALIPPVSGGVDVCDC